MLRWIFTLQGVALAVKDIVVDQRDEDYMSTAAQSANSGVRAKHGGPFGAAVVSPDGAVLSASHNCVLKNQDPSCHAEVMAIREALAVSKSVEGCDLYTTCEPCPMCWGCIHKARLRSVFIGVGRDVAAEFGFDDSEFYRKLCKEDTRKHRKGSFVKVGLKDGVRSKVNARRAEKRLERSDLSMASVSTLDTDAMFPSPGSDAFSYGPMHPDVGDDSSGLERARSLAWESGREQAVLVVSEDGMVVGSGVDRCAETGDCTDTAVRTAIKDACEVMETYDLSGCTVYSVREPCVYDRGMLLWARVDDHVFGMTAEEQAEKGLDTSVLQQKEDLREFDEAARFGGPGQSREGLPVYVRGVATDECRQVFQNWHDSNHAVIY